MAEDPWFEDDSFWETWEPVMFSKARLEGTEAEVARIVEVLDLEAGAHVLDLPSGPGRHSLELARRGFRVAAVDRTNAYLEKLQEAAQAEDLDVETVEADMRAFRRESAFDAVLNLYSSFGYFEDPADDRRVLEGFFASLRPGGNVFLETIAKETLARIFRPDVGAILEDGSIMVEHHELRDDWSWIENRWILVRPDGERLEHRLGHRLYSAAELRGLLLDVGFEDVRTFDGFRDAPYDHRAGRLGIAARKPHQE